MKKSLQSLSYIILLCSIAHAFDTGEMRGVWISDPTEFKWKKVVKNLKKARLNHIFINFASAGVAFYPSNVLPSRVPREPLEKLISIAHENNIKVHAKILCFFLHWAPQNYREKMIRERRVLINTKGKVQYQSETPWLDPGQHGNRETVKAITKEILEKFDVDGVQLDYVRYFEEMGVPEPIMNIRRVIITNFVIEMGQLIRLAKPEITYSACTFYNPKRAIEEMAQDWVTWDAKNIFDFLVHMNYTTFPGELKKWIDCQKFLHKGDTIYYSGLGSYMAKMTPAKLIREIDMVRKSGYPGFILFSYNEDFEKRMIPELAKKFNPASIEDKKQKKHN